MENIKNEFEKIKNDKLSKSLFRLFIVYEKSLTETENQYIFIDYINILKKYNVNENTLQVLIDKHRLNVDNGSFFPKINQLLKPILINNQIKFRPPYEGEVVNLFLFINYFIRNF